MKKTMLSLCLLMAASVLSAQDFSQKQGKVTDYELRMASYEPDTSAAAVILYENTDIYYSITVTSMTQEILVCRNYYMKAKVLRQEGADVGDMTINYFVTPTTKENVKGISAIAYNLENGKRVETQLKRQYIFTEQLSDNQYRIKFSVPDVKAGSVVEVKYTLESAFYDRIDPIVFQHEYPVVYSCASVSIPEYFRFNINTQGYHPVNVVRGSANGSYHYGSEVQSFRQETFKCEAKNIPGLKDEPQVWCPSDFRSTLYFELGGFDFPGSVYKPVTSTWKSVNETLEQSNFGSNLKASNPFKSEVAAICASTSDEMERITAIHKLVTSRMAWDEQYRLVSKNMRSAADNGAGTSADINFALNSALRGAGFQTVPILLNPRPYGRLPVTHPSIDKINAFIIRVTLADGRFVYLDGTSKYSGPNVLPGALMVDRARVYGDNDNAPGGGWVDLTHLNTNMMSSLVIAKLDAQGQLTGKIMKVYENAMAMNLKRKYNAAKDEDKYIEGLEEEDGIEISEFKISGLDAQTTEQSYGFTRQVSRTGDYIYLNATIFPFMSKNPLTAQERELPIEFSSPDFYTITCNIELPEGYVVEELPKAIRMSACENGISMQYIAQASGTTLQIMMRYNMDRIIYPVNEYPDLRTFFGMLTTLSTSQIILKKQ